MVRKKILLGSIFVLALMLLIPCISGIQKNTIEDEINKETGFWKTNYFCRISAYVDGASCEPELGLGFVKHAEGNGPVNYFHISGLLGKDNIENGEHIHIRVDGLFGYVHMRWQSFLSVFHMKGFAIKCEYMVD